MKKHFALLCTMLLAACALTFVACDDDEAAVSENKTSSKPTQKPSDNDTPSAPVIEVPASDPNDYGTLTEQASVATGSYKDVTYMSVTILSSLKEADESLVEGGVPAIQIGVNRNTLTTLGSIYEGTMIDGSKCETIIDDCVPGQIYYYVACYVKDGEVVKYSSDIRLLSTVDLTMGAVDLGLSVKWASSDVGSLEPQIRGAYFAWGEVKTKPVYDYNTSETYEMSLDLLKQKGYVDANGNLTPEHDAAVQASIAANAVVTVVDEDEESEQPLAMLPGDWRMPTADEMLELLVNCNLYIGSYRDVYGTFLESQINGEMIFIPYQAYSAATKEGLAWYWSSTADVGNYATYAMTLERIDESKLEQQEDEETSELRKRMRPVKTVFEKRVVKKAVVDIVNLSAYKSRTIGLPIRPVQK